MLIAAPGERKSGVMRAMTSVLYDYEQEFNKSRSDEVRKNRQEQEAVERQISGLKKKLENKYDREMEMELQQLEGQLAEMPELKPVRFFADDCSSEALTSLLANNGGRLAVISAEGGIFDIMAGRYSNKTNMPIKSFRPQMFSNLQSCIARKRQCRCLRKSSRFCARSIAAILS